MNTSLLDLMLDSNCATTQLILFLIYLFVAVLGLHCCMGFL